MQLFVKSRNSQIRYYPWSNAKGAEFSKWQKQTDFAFDPNSREAYLYSFCGDIQGHIVDIPIDRSLEH